MSPQTETKTVLIVDDDKEVRQGLTVGLDPREWNCVCFESWKEASEKVPSEIRPDVAIIDLDLPNDEPPSGLEVMKRLAELMAELPIVALTGHPDYEDAAQRCLEMGAVQFVRKPVRSAELADRLCHAIWIKQVHVEAIREAKEAGQRAVREAARRSQEALLPKEEPKVEGLKIHRHSRPATVVAGDYYDFIYVRGTQDFILAIGDATGHDVPAAICAHFVGGALRAVAADAGKSFSPALAIGAINRVVSSGDVAR